MKIVTIHNLEESTEQEVFDFVAHHLLTQNEKAMDVSGNCLYKLKLDNKTLKCAAGCLIPDEDYQKFIEEDSWLSVIEKLSVTEKYKELILDLQHLHDNCDVTEWKMQLDELIRLKYPNLNSDILSQFN